LFIKHSKVLGVFPFALEGSCHLFNSSFPPSLPRSRKSGPPFLVSWPLRPCPDFFAAYFLSFLKSVVTVRSTLNSQPFLRPLFQMCFLAVPFRWLKVIFFSFPGGLSYISRKKFCGDSKVASTPFLYVHKLMTFFNWNQRRIGLLLFPPSYARRKRLVFFKSFTQNYAQRTAFIPVKFVPGMVPLRFAFPTYSMSRFLFTEIQ